MISPKEVEQRIVASMPDARVAVRDLTGGMDHYQVEVISGAFEGLRPVQRHRLVYGLFEDVLGGPLHALSLNTKTPAEADRGDA